MKKSIAVLLTVHNRREKTLRCLGCLFGQDIPQGYDMNVWLTDDGCTDGTPEAVREQFPAVKIIQGDGNLYWNRGMLKAWEAASTEKSYDYYMWLNDDVTLKTQAIDSLLQAAATKNDEAIIVGATSSFDNSRVTYGGRTESGAIPPESDKLTKVSYFYGNIVFVPKAVFDKVGMLDPYYSHSKGDFDYGLRATKLGVETFQVGKCLGYCDLHERLDEWCDPSVPFRKRWKAFHRPNGQSPREVFHFDRRHHGIPNAAFHFCTVYLRCLVPWLWTLLDKSDS